MKNPFVKESNTGLIAGVALGTLAAGAVVYLLLSERGSGLRQELRDQFSRLVDKVRGDGADVEDHDVRDYTYKRPKAPKTDREALLHHDIIS